jgi:thiamine kinase-like enzyme
VLALHRPPLEALRYLSAASVELVKELQRDAAACRAMEELREGWSAVALVHRDVKWANCIAVGGAIKLVDWEMAGWGDPAWDIGSALAELAARPAAAVALWRAYAAARAPDPGLRDRALRFAGARLVQTAFEHAQELVTLDDRATTDLRAGCALLVTPRLPGIGA